MNGVLTLAPRWERGTLALFYRTMEGGERSASAIGNNGFSDRFLGVFLSLGFLLQLAA
jgi:hypothetical protein